MIRSIQFHLFELRLSGNIFGGLFIIIFLFPQCLSAQKNSYDFIRYNSSDGLSQNSVVAITQDANGVMWFGTRDGLNAYDGERFEVFRSQEGDSLSLSNNDILNLVVDPDNNIWIGTTNGLNRYDHKKGTFTRFYHDPADKSSIAGNTIRKLLTDQRFLWIGTRSGLSVYQLDSGTIYDLSSQQVSEPVRSGQVTALLSDGKGGIWLALQQDLYHLTVAGKSDPSFSSRLVYSAPSGIQAIYQTEKNQLFLGTKENGLLLFDTAGNSIIKKVTYPELTGNDVRALDIDLEGNLWVGTYEGISIIREDQSVIQVVSNKEDRRALSKNTIKSIFTDTQGSVWIGVYYGGINVWNQSNFNFKSIGYGSSSQLSYDVVSQINSFQNQIIVGTEGGGITFLSEDGETEYLLSENSDLPSNNVKSLLVDDGTLLIGTFDAGLAYYDLLDKKFTGFVDQSSGVKSNSIYSIAKSDDFYWLGTFGGGLYALHPESDSISHFAHDPAKNTSLTDDQIRMVYIDSGDRLWVGTQNGLNLSEPDKINAEGFKRFLFNEETGFGENVLCVFEDARGRIWCGTNEGGLNLYQNGEFVRISLKEKGSNLSNTVRAIEEDRSGNLWISTNNGIIKYAHETGETDHFHQIDGLVSNEYNSHSSHRLANSGLIYFGSPQGITFFNPDMMSRNRKTPKVIINGLTVNNREVSPGDETNILEEHIINVEKIVLDYDQAIFSLSFALPNYVNPGKNAYVYRLQGLSDQFIKTTNPSASFTIQNQGTYLFEVYGVNSEGIQSGTATLLEIEVEPAPWKTPWAFALYIASILIALYFLTKIVQIQTRLKHELETEHQKADQEKEISKQKLEFFTNISHEFRTPLTLILGQLQHILQEYRGSRNLFKQLVTIEKNADRLLKLINQLMDFRKLENKEFNLQAAEGDIVKFVKEVFLSFQSLAKNEGYQYEMTADEEQIALYFDRDKMERVLFNLLSNAFKYTPAGGNISVHIKSTGEFVDISVSDSGEGMELVHRDKIFERFYRIKKGSAREPKMKGTGIGLALAKGIIELHGGRIRAESDGFQKGSTMIVSLPTGREHLQDSQVIEGFQNSENISLYDKQGENQDLSSAVFEQEKKSDKKILIVEDNDDLRSFIAELLSEYHLLLSENGKEALKIAETEQPDLVLSDVMMPEMDGISLCTELKSSQKTSHIPVMLLTARTSLIFKYQGLESGADDYINKPFNIKELQLKVRNLLASMTRLKERFSESGVINPSEVTVTSIDEELMKDAIRIVDDNISNEFFDIAMFCKELGISRTLLFAKVKAWTDLTPNEFILTMRMKRAANLLEQRKISVAQVCFKVGYKDPKYFSKSFQKFHHMTPTQYMNRFVDPE
ncbi:MAG: two-component regulator propeller domain-containing protein [Cyclobacteriaceae bacterium]